MIRREDRSQLAGAWLLAATAAPTSLHVAAVMQFLDDGRGGIDGRALHMFELAVEIRKMEGTLDTLLRSWISWSIEERQDRAATQPLDISTWEAA